MAHISSPRPTGDRTRQPFPSIAVRAFPGNQTDSERFRSLPRTEPRNLSTMPVAEHAQMRGHEPKVERERWITRLACVRNAWRPAARSSGYPASAIGDAARMKGRTKRAEDVSSDGPGDPSLTRTYRRNRRRTPEGGDH